MKIRSITAFLPQPTSESIRRAAMDCRQIKEKIQSHGWEVQTLRLATAPFTRWVAIDSSPSGMIKEMEQQIKADGFDYLSVGSLPAEELTGARWIPDILQNTDSTFCTLHLVKDKHFISNPAIREAVQIILQNSKADPLGFTNLRFAALANVPDECPFFPSASAGLDHPSYALAIEGADLAVEVFTEAATIADAITNLTTRITTAATDLTQLVEMVVHEQFSGIDFTLAPFPDSMRSIGTALERLGLSGFGQPGSLAAAALLMSIQDQCQYKKVGFNGLMLPVMEDSTLALRNEQGILSVDQLLLYSTVCGTGLDCIPLPGDIQPTVLEAILLDVAALSCRLYKPLTARLMPVPGKKVGEMTSYEFDYFANSRIMDPGIMGVAGILQASQDIPVIPRYP